MEQRRMTGRRDRGEVRFVIEEQDRNRDHHPSPAALRYDFLQTAEDVGGIEELIAQQRESAAQRGERDPAGQAVTGDVAADDGKASVDDEVVVVVAADL